MVGIFFFNLQTDRRMASDAGSEQEGEERRCLWKAANSRAMSDCKELQGCRGRGGWRLNDLSPAD